MYESKLHSRLYESKLHSRAKLHNHLVFCLRCRNEGLVQKDLWISPPVKTTRARVFAEKSSCFYLLKDEQQKINRDDEEILQ